MEFNQFDYRKELKNLLAERQSRNPSYSIRALARDLEVSSTALHGVLTNTRHFSKKNLENLSLKLGWSPQQLEAALENVNTLEDTTESFLTGDRFSMIADWIHLAILNLAKIPGVSADSVSERLGLDPLHCEQALERLERLEFIEITAEGLLKRREPSFGTSEDTPSQAIRAFHYKNLTKAQDALQNVPVHQRDFLTIAAPTNGKKIAELKKMIQEFRKQVMQVLETSEPDSVYFLNVQLYPVTSFHSQQEDSCSL